MNEYLLLMHDDAPRDEDMDAWGPYLAMLRATGRFDGGSSIGSGKLVGETADRSALSPVVGLLRVRAESFEAARVMLDGNPVLLAGGTVEIRVLLQD